MVYWVQHSRIIGSPFYIPLSLLLESMEMELFVIVRAFSHQYIYPLVLAGLLEGLSR